MRYFVRQFQRESTKNQSPAVRESLTPLYTLLNQSLQQQLKVLKDLES